MEMGLGRGALGGGRGSKGILWLVFGVASCGSPAEPTNASGASGEPIRRDTTIVHEPCDVESGATSKGDANADGRPDVVTVSEAGKPVCQWLDLNFDSVGDVWVYYAADGAVRRRETDFDRDGRIDELTTLSNSVVVTRQRATTLAGRLDTWQYFERGVLTRGERDANGDGVVDQWWEYPKTDKSECAVVHSDTNGDGRPDPGATVDLCASQDALDGQSPETAQDGPAFDVPLTESTAEVEAPPPTSPAKPTTPPEAAPPARNDAAKTGEKQP
jgi:hypothetical protein